MLVQMSLEKENTKAFLILNENYTHIQGGKSYELLKYDVVTVLYNFYLVCWFSLKPISFLRVQLWSSAWI